jgi:DNA mismatch repair protein MutS2
MDEKSLGLLEFPRIREIIAGYTRFPASLELAKAIEPLSDYEAVAQLLRQSGESRRLLALKPNFGIGDVSDIREFAKKAAVGSVLEPQNLLEIQRTLAAMRLLRAELSRLADEAPLLWGIAKDITELSHIEKAIAKCLSPAGEVLDSASAALAGLRRQSKETHAELMANLEKFISSPKIQPVLQDGLITERFGRYVIPVKIESRQRVKGIVHDLSNTGATVFVEPQVTVGLGNALRELEVAERHEVEKILTALSGQVAEYQIEIAWNVRAAAELDLLLAKARYAREAGATEPEITSPDKDNGRPYLRLASARHPLLGQKAVPLSVELGRDFSILIITGPNTGGKTVSLKTIGLLAAMTQAGIPIPAAPESVVPIFDAIYSDIGDEQSIEHTLSTFSWHIGNIVRIINGATAQSLVLLDELGTSTDPAEGSALARAILRHFLTRGILTVATTHHSDLKAFAHVTPGLANASLDFDPQTLRPTYHLRVGVPGGSNALETASRLGLSSSIVSEARSMLSTGSRELETLITDLTEERRDIEELRGGLERERAAAATKSAELESELTRLKAERVRLIQETRDSLLAEVADLHREIRDAAAGLRKKKTEETLREARKVVAEVRKGLQEKVRLSEEAGNEEALAELRIAVGDTVWLKELQVQAKVLAVTEESGEAEVQVGQSRVRLGLHELEKRAPASAKAPPVTGRFVKPDKRGVAMSLDLRGKRAHEVEALLDTYLNDASLANLAEARIVHGFGGGTVRDIVRGFLPGHPLVRSFRSGRREEGGDGVTVVSL